MKIRSAIYLNALVLVVGPLSYLLPMPYSAIGVTLAAAIIVISIGFGVKRLFDKYPPESVGIVMVLIGSILSKIGYDDGRVMRKISSHGKTVSGIVKGGSVRTTKRRSGEVRETYLLDVSYVTADGRELTRSFSVPEDFGHKYVEFHTGEWVTAKAKAAAATDLVEKTTAEIEAFRVRDYGANAFNRDAKPYIKSDASLEVRYVVGEPATAFILGAEPRDYDMYFLLGVMLGVGGVVMFGYGIKARRVRVVVPHIRTPRKPQVQPMAKVVAMGPMVYVLKEGAPAGPYPKTQLPHLVQNGILLPTDLAWEEGMNDWAPLATLLSA